MSCGEDLILAAAISPTFCTKRPSETSCVYIHILRVLMACAEFTFRIHRIMASDQPDSRSSVPGNRIDEEDLMEAVALTWQPQPKGARTLAAPCAPSAPPSLSTDPSQTLPGGCFQVQANRAYAPTRGRINSKHVCSVSIRPKVRASAAWKV